MRVTILYIDECPNWREAGSRVRAALDKAGVDADIEFRLVATRGEAAQMLFAGSPTILFDGVDAFPGGGRISDLACRIYRTPVGFAGLPTAEQCADAVRESIVG